MRADFKSGFVTLIGRPNVGKSTLMNYLIGQKIAITSNKPQTTRNRIQTVLTTDEGQIVFVDTPGIHKAKNKLGLPWGGGPGDGPVERPAELPVVGRATGQPQARLQLLGREQGRWPGDHASRRVRSHRVGSHELLHERQQLESGETGLQLHEELRGRGAGESLAKRENLACRRLPHGVRHQGASSPARGTPRNLHVQRRLGRARQG